MHNTSAYFLMPGWLLVSVLLQCSLASELCLLMSLKVQINALDVGIMLGIIW
jgi:hypothetical protein